MQNTFRNNGQTDPATSIVRTVIVPVSGPILNASRSLSDTWSGFTNRDQLTRDAQRARSLDLIAQQYGEQVEFYQAELRRLRSLLLLPEYPGKDKVPAAVTGYFPGESRMTLNTGSNQGVKPGMPVLTAEGLAGVVQSVDKATCQFLLLSSPQLKIGALIRRSPPPAGLIRGETTRKMVLEIIDVTTTVQPGDLVVTSGHSELIPSGIPIGIVSERTEYPEFGTVRCQVFPNSTPGEIREVVILK